MNTILNSLVCISTAYGKHFGWLGSNYQKEMLKLKCVIYEVFDEIFHKTLKKIFIRNLIEKWKTHGFVHITLVILLNKE